MSIIETIIKRNQEEVPYNPERIRNAINSAFTYGFKKPDYHPDLDDLTNQVQTKLIAHQLFKPNIEEIQDAVEEVLMENGYSGTAKAYVLYRAERTRIRDAHLRLMKIYEDITFKEAKNSNIKRENANVNGDTAMGTMLKYGSEGAKQFYMEFVLKPEHAQAHQNGDIHIHDLDFYPMTTTCCQIDLLRLFKDGFGTGHGILREPNDIQSYAALTCIAIQANQNDQHGGQSIPNFDYGLAPGVLKTFRRLYRQNLAKALELNSLENTASPETNESSSGAVSSLDPELQKIHEQMFQEGWNLSLEDYADFLSHEAEILRQKQWAASSENLEKMQKWAISAATRETDRATYQAMEALIHNLNTMHSRAGAQTPFSSINYGMDTTPEGRLVTKNVLLAHERGLGNGETPIFPIHIFRVKEGINTEPGDPNYDLFQLACRVSAKRMFPNFAFQDAPYNLKYYKKGHPETEIAYMGCRTRVIGNVFDPEHEISYSRGNLSFTSINLPRIALKTKGNIDWFYDELKNKIDLCINQLLERFEIQSSKKVKNFPFLMGEGIWLGSDKLSAEDEVRPVLGQGTLSVGFIGLAETLKILTGFHHGESEEAQKLGLEIVGFMRFCMDRESERRKMNFTLLATPAEGLAGRFVPLDRKRFGLIEGVTDRDYYTNSFHIPVWYPISIYDKIRLEAPYHALTNAGHITYVEMDGDVSQNPDAFEKVIHLMRKSGVGYGAINHPIDHDPVCGYNGIIGETCPRCGRPEGDIPFDRIRRITGYLVGTLDRFNNAKRKEVIQRVKHSLKGGDQ